MIEINFTEEYFEQIRLIIREEVQAALQKKTDKVYTVKEACALMRISASTFHRWVDDGSLRVTKKGSKVLVTEEEIQRTMLNFKR